MGMKCLWKPWNPGSYGLSEIREQAFKTRFFRSETWILEVQYGARKQLKQVESFNISNTRTNGSSRQRYHLEKDLTPPAHQGSIESGSSGSSTTGFWILRKMKRMDEGFGASSGSQEHCQGSVDHWKEAEKFDFKLPMRSAATIAFKHTGDEQEEGKPPEQQSGEEEEKQEAPILRPDNEAKDLPLNTTGTLGNQTSREPQNTKEKLGHRRIDEQGGVSYKKVPTNALMQAIQLGISNSIGSLASLPNRDVLLQDFEKVDIVAFPAAGSTITPSHSFGDFRFRTYAPIAFRYFRNLFHIKPADFLRSICTEPLKELSNAGASGSIFYVSQDDQFIIKTVQHKEADFLQKLLPGYYMNLNQNPRTLLPKFFGLFCYQSLGKNIRLLVMNNLLPQTVTMHEKYDLKGSTYKRMANKAERAKPHPTLKDLDFLECHKDGIFIDPIALDALMRSISRDCLVMESFKIMDYSLLVGIHNVELGIKERAELNGESLPAPSTSNGATSSSNAREAKESVSGEKGEEHKVLQEKFSVWDTGDGDVPHGGVPARNSNGDRLVLYLGIIDILQNYRLLKKMEHTWKAILHDGDTISVHNPNFYASRFLSFMNEKVFKKGTALKQSPSRRRMLKGNSNDEDPAYISGGHRQHKESERDGLNMTAEPGASTSTPREVFGVQTARESTRLYNREAQPGTSEERSERANSARDPPSSMSRVPLRRSYRDAGQAMSVEKKEKKVERLFAQPKPTDEKVPEEQETEEIMTETPKSTEASPQFLSLWQNSDHYSKIEAQAVTRGLVQAARDSPTSDPSRSALWQNLSSMSSADQAHLMSRLSSSWPFRDERRALTWPVHAGLLANCVTSALIATRINSEMFLFDAKTKFLESIRKCPKAPFVFGVYSSGVTYFMLHQMLITPKVYNELTPCPSCLVINSIAIGLTTGVGLPLLATPYLSHYVLLNREVGGASGKTGMPIVSNLLEFLMLGWEGSKPARSIVPACVAIQMVVSFGAMYAVLWGRERMFSTLELDTELARRLVAEAQTSSSLKQKILDFLKKIPMVNGIVPEAPENERVV